MSEPASSRRRRASSEVEDRPSKRCRVEEEEEIPNDFADCSFQHFTCSQLRAAAKKHGLESTGKLKKAQLVEKLERVLLEARECLFDFRHKLVARPTLGINASDAISLADFDSWSKEYIFKVEAKDKSRGPVRTAHYFDPVTLVEMILRTGETFNPFTREELSSEDILRLEHAYVNCIRAHPTAPALKRDLLSHRPDLKCALILPLPQPADLGIEEGGELPGPVLGFAPWLEYRSLLQLARFQKARIGQEREHARTVDFLWNEVCAAFDVLVFLASTGLEPGISWTYASCNNFFQILHQACLPTLLEKCSQLFELDVASVTQFLLEVVEQVSSRQFERSDVVHRAWRWVISSLLDALWKKTFNAQRRRPISVNRALALQRLLDVITRLFLRHSTDELVRDSIEIEIELALF